MILELKKGKYKCLERTVPESEKMLEKVGQWEGHVKGMQGQP